MAGHDQRGQTLQQDDQQPDLLPIQLFPPLHHLISAFGLGPTRSGLHGRFRRHPQHRTPLQVQGSRAQGQDSHFHGLDVIVGLSRPHQVPLVSGGSFGLDLAAFHVQDEKREEQVDQHQRGFGLVQKEHAHVSLVELSGHRSRLQISLT